MWRNLFLFTNSSIFLFFLTYHLKCLSLPHCITKSSHVWNMIWSFFLLLHNRFFLFGRCSTKGAALRKEPHSVSQKTSIADIWHGSKYVFGGFWRSIPLINMNKRHYPWRKVLSSTICTCYKLFVKIKVLFKKRASKIFLGDR